MWSNVAGTTCAQVACHAVGEEEPAKAPCQALRSNMYVQQLTTSAPARTQVACRAKGEGGGEVGAPALSLDALAPLTRTPLYRTWLQGAVVLVILGAVDAGWSGDWSRTGVLTTGQEAQLRGLLTLLGFFHIGAATSPDAAPGHSTCHASALTSSHKVLALPTPSPQMHRPWITAGTCQSACTACRPVPLTC
jgi:hypothetical protein